MPITSATDRSKYVQDRVCMFCNQTFKGWISGKVCKSPECRQKLHDRKTKQMEQGGKKHKSVSTKNPPKESSNYKCIYVKDTGEICGEDPFPNRFYCPMHHDRISSRVNTTDIFPDIPLAEEVM